MAAVMVYIITIYLVEYIVYRIAKNKLSIAITVREPDKKSCRTSTESTESIWRNDLTPAVVGNH